MFNMHETIKMTQISRKVALITNIGALIFYFILFLILYLDTQGVTTWPVFHIGALIFLFILFLILY